MEIYHSVIHQNLKLLTKVIPNLDMESKLQKGMLKKPNSKGMQTIFYSFISILNPEYCRKWVPWPVSFTSDSYNFRSAVIEFIKKECSDVETPKLLPSLLNKADGEKYVKFVFNFATYVTKILIQKRFGELLCEKPNVNVNYEENLDLLDAAIVAVFQEDAYQQREYEKFKNESSEWIKLSETNLMATLKDYRAKKALLLTELEEVIPHSQNIEELSIDHSISEFEREILQLKRNHDKLQADINRILKKQEYLLFLLNLKQELDSDNFEIDTFNNLSTNQDISAAVHEPVNVMLKKMIITDGSAKATGYGICLKQFLFYGRLIITAHIERFRKLNLSSQQFAICCTANDILSNSVERITRFKNLIAKIDEIAKDCQTRQLIGKQQKCDTDDNSCEDITQSLVKLWKGYDFRLDLAVNTKNILPVFLTEIDCTKNSVERIKEKLQTSVLISSTERTAKLYPNY